MSLRSDNGWRWGHREIVGKKYIDDGYRGRCVGLEAVVDSWFNGYSGVVQHRNDGNGGSAGTVAVMEVMSAYHRSRSESEVSSSMEKRLFLKGFR